MRSNRELCNERYLIAHSVFQQKLPIQTYVRTGSHTITYYAEYNIEFFSYSASYLRQGRLFTFLPMP